MIILGFDPGLATLGYGVIEKDEKGKCTAIDCGIVHQLSHPLSFPSPHALNLPQHQGLFQ